MTVILVLAHFEHIDSQAPCEALCKLSYFIFIVTLRRFCYYPHFPDLDTESQSGEVTVQGHTASKHGSGT